MERSDVPDGAPPLKRKIAAILAADVAGYSRLVAIEEEGTLRRLAASRDIFDGLVHRGGGRIFNTAGDSVMCEFDSAVEAVRVAIDIQDSLATASAGTDPAKRIQFRIGITIGDVVERGQDLLGDGVNIAARLQSIAPPGGVCISRSVHEAVANKIPVEFEDIGARKLKNLPQPVHAFVVARQPAALRPGEPILIEPRPGRLPDPAAGNGGRPRLGLLVTLGLLLAAGAAAVPGLPAMKRAYESWRPAESTQSKPPSNLATSTPVEVVTPPRAADQPPKAPAPSKAAPRTADKQPDKPAEKQAVPDKPALPEQKPEPRAVLRPMPVPEAAAAFAALRGRGIVPDPNSLPEIYHNARLHETRGDRGASLRGYAEVAPLAGDAVDVPIRYASLLRSASGAEAARKGAQELLRTNPGRSAALVAAIQADGADRRARLEGLTNEHPDFLPAAYFLAEALMEKREGGPTLTNRRLAFAALDRFLDGAETGALTPLFVDRSFLDGWIDAARARRQEIEAHFASAAVRPSATFRRTEAGWVARIALPEPAGQVSARIGETGEVAPASSGPAGPTSAAEIPLPATLGRTTLYVSYRDPSGREAGPFPIPFDPGSALASTGRDALERNPDSWVAFRPDLPDVLTFAQLVANRCALKGASIGIGDEPPTQALPLPSCQPGMPGAVPEGRSAIALPAGTEAVQIQLSYTDGTESQIRTFRRP